MRSALAAAVLSIAAGLLVAAPLSAQEPEARPEPPPPGGIVERERPHILGFGIASLSWDGESPYDDLTMSSLVLERSLQRLFRARAGIAYGGTTFDADGEVDTRVMSLDLQLVVVPDVGPLHDFGVLPYVLGGCGTLVTNPSGEGGRDLPTRSQSQVAWGLGVLARIGSRFEARGERIRARVRLADPIDATNQETTSIHTNRWEGRISWVF